MIEAVANVPFLEGGKMLSLVLAVSVLVPAQTLGPYSKVGATGSLGRHEVIWRGEILTNAAEVRSVTSPKQTLMRHIFAVNTRKLDEFWFLLKGVENDGWQRGQIKTLPKQMKVTGWHDYMSGDQEVSVQVLEPIED